MLQILHIVQLVISVLLIATVVLQQRGGGLSASFGGDGGVYHTRRGVEKSVFRATIVLTVLFFAAAIVNIVLLGEAARLRAESETATSTPSIATSTDLTSASSTDVLPVTTPDGASDR